MRSNISYNSIVIKKNNRNEYFGGPTEANLNLKFKIVDYISIHLYIILSVNPANPKKTRFHMSCKTIKKNGFVVFVVGG